MSNNVRIIFEGDAQSAIRAMRQLTGEMDRVDASTGRLRDTFLGVLGADLVDRGLVALTRGLRDSHNAATENARVQTQLQAVLRSTGGAAGLALDELNQMSAALQESTRFTDEEIGRVQALMLTFTNIKDDIFPQTTQAILDMATAMGTDLQSATLQVGKALQDPTEGLTALRRVGVAFTDEQQELIKTLVQTGRGMEAQKMILAELNREFGSSAESMTDYERRVDSIQDAAGEFQEKVGFAMIGALMELSDWLIDNEDILSGWADALVSGLDVATEEVGTRIGALIGFLEEVWGAIEAGIDLVDDLVHGRWQDAWEDLVTVGERAGKALINLLVMMFGQIPNIVIGAMNEAIRALNSFELPTLSLPGVGNVIPGGGKNLGLPEIPTIPTRAFDLGDVQGAFERLAETGRGAASSNEALADTGAKTERQFSGMGGAAKKAATLLEELGGVFSTINGVTRERADLEVRLAELELAKLVREQRSDDIAKAKEIENKAVATRNKNAGIFDMYQWMEMQGLPAPGTFGQPKSQGGIDKQIEAIQRAIDIENKRSDLLEKQFKAANRALLTDEERDRIAHKLIEAVRLETSNVQTLNDKVGLLIPNLAQMNNVVTGIIGIANYVSNVATQFTGSPHATGSELMRGFLRADGGPVTAGQLYRIHERGLPEFYRPSHSGTIYPLGAVPSGRSPSVINVSVQIDRREIGRALVELQGSGGLRGVLEAAA